MDYIKHYKLLINKAYNRNILENTYYEKHHIIPKCLGGSDFKTNIVLLKPEEHYVAHQLLIKIYPNEPKLIYAANMMTVEGSGQKERSNNKRYSWLKKKYISECKKRIGDKNPSYNKKWYYNPNTLESRKLHHKDVPDNWRKGRVINGKNKYCLWCKNNIGLEWKTSKSYCSDVCKKEKYKKRRYDIFLELYPKFIESNLSLRKFVEKNKKENGIPLSTLAKIFSEFKHQ